MLAGLSVVFFCLGIHSAWRSEFGSRFDLYFFLMMGLCVACAFVPIRHEVFEQRLADVAEILLARSNVIVDCNSYLEAMFHLGPAGYVYQGSNVINLEIRTCRDLQGYLDNPQSASYRELWALHILTHEAMHIAGEFNEQLADCQAFQRNHKTAELLGVPKHIAERNAVELHHRRPTHNKKYYSSECRPGGNMDEQLEGAVWR